MELRVLHLTVRYKDLIAIENAHIEAFNKEIVGFIGPDGAGKSSTMHSIAGVIPFEGAICFGDICYHSPKEAEPTKPHLGLMPQGLGLVLYPFMSVEEHLDFFTEIRGIKKDETYWRYRHRLLEMAGLAPFTKRLAMHLSGGMKQKLSLICTLIHRPSLLILDEPTTGVDPLSRQELWEILEQIRKEQDIIILYSTAYMQEAQKMDRLYLFDQNRIIASGTPQELIDSARAYTYQESECEECFTFNGRTYSLKPLKAPHAEPTLEALFFINALKHGKKEVEFHIPPRASQHIPPIIVEAKGLTKRFGDFVADDHIDLTLKRGEILGLLGANGAGKTTFIKMLLGLYPIDEGELYLLGKRITSDKDRIALKNQIGYMSQNFALYKDLTLKENMLYFAKLHGIERSRALEKIDDFAKKLGFYDYLEELPQSLPMGINQRFSLATAILHEPVVLFLDEPTSGVDTVARAAFWKLLHKLKSSWGVSILITTHYMSEAKYCDRVVVLKEGKKIVDEEVRALMDRFEGMSFEEIFLSFYKDRS